MSNILKIEKERVDILGIIANSLCLINYVISNDKSI
jgi:hypothetical protein